MAKNQNFLIALAYLAVVVAGYQFIPETMLYDKDGFSPVLPMIIVVLGGPIIALFGFKLFAPTINPKLLMTLMAFAGMSGYIFSDYYRLYQIDNALKNSGISTTARITDYHYENNYKGFDGNVFICEFEAINGNTYNTFKQKDIDEAYQEGDTLSVVYLDRNPEISDLQKNLK